MFRHLSPFFFSGVLPLLCSAQGLPGGFGGGGEPPINSGGQATPPAPPASGATPPAPPAAPPTDPNAQPPAGQFQAGWLNDRIAQAKASATKEALAALGVSDIDSAKALLEEGKKAKDATKSEVQRLQEQIDALTPTKAQAEKYQGQLSTIADRELAKLPAAAQERIKALVGDKPDPVKLLEAIDLAHAMGGTASDGTATGQHGQPQPGQTPGAPGQGPNPAAPPMAPPANTTGALGGPPSAPGSPPDHLAHWNWLKERQPMRAAGYFLQHQEQIVAQQQANPKR